MARTIDTIKAELTTNFMSNSTLAEKYGFEEGSEFSSVFSRVSLENLILYIVAVAIYTLETLFDTHKQEVSDIVADMKPHTLRWYVNKAKDFMYGYPLVDGSDTYNIEGMSEDDIEEAKIVKFAACSESSNATLYMKVAKDEDGERQPLSDDEVSAFKSYIHEVKDAGVRVDVINEPGDYLQLNIIIYYDPLILTAKGQHKESGVYIINETVKDFVENLPFNSEYRNNDLVDALQATEGVEMVELSSAAYCNDGVDYQPINGYCKPYSGYFKYDRAGEGTTLNVTYVAYDGNEN